MIYLWMNCKNLNAVKDSWSMNFWFILGEPTSSSSLSAHFLILVQILKSVVKVVKVIKYRLWLWKWPAFSLLCLAELWSFEGEGECPGKCWGVQTEKDTGGEFLRQVFALAESDLGNPESRWAGEWYRSRGCCKNGQRDSDPRSYWNVGKYVPRHGGCSTGRRNINIWKTNLNSYMEADLPLWVADDLAKSGNQRWP